LGKVMRLAFCSATVQQLTAAFKSWSGKVQPFSIYASGRGSPSTLSRTSFNALRVSLAKPLLLCIEDESIQLLIRKKVLAHFNCHHGATRSF
jgi:hypothetical protein